MVKEGVALGKTLLSPVFAAGLAGGPLILKPAVACGLPCSHAMALALGAKHVGQAMNQGGLQLPVVAQQFSNHGGTVAKVYVAGDKVRPVVGRAGGMG